MDLKRKKKLTKLIEKAYYQAGQSFVFSALEVFPVPFEGGVLHDICLYDLHKKESIAFLFTITTYDGYVDLEGTSSLGLLHTPSNWRSWRVFDAIAASSRPYFWDDTFTVPRAGTLTLEDLFKASRYFVERVLGLKYRIWNYRFCTEDEVFYPGDPKSLTREEALKREYRGLETRKRGLIGKLLSPLLRQK